MQQPHPSGWGANSVSLLDYDFSLIHSHRSTDDIVGACLNIVEDIGDRLVFDDRVDAAINTRDSQTRHTSFPVVARRDDKFVIFACGQGNNFRDEA